MLTNVYFWASIFLSLVGFFLFRFGMISRGASRSQTESTGGVLILISAVSVFALVNFKALIVFILLFWFLVTPIVEVLISQIYKKLYGVKDEWVAKKYNTTVDDVKKHTYLYLNQEEDAVADRVTKELLDKYNNKDTQIARRLPTKKSGKIAHLDGAFSGEVFEKNLINHLIKSGQIKPDTEKSK